ncbi:hypothetical protein M0802_006944 [Mischocyttarus mexicanus]|nr:hypothetical protein M0802_006944 [Mischocyttarus mexicanus]
MVFFRLTDATTDTRENDEMAEAVPRTTLLSYLLESKSYPSDPANKSYIIDVVPGSCPIVHEEKDSSNTAKMVDLEGYIIMLANKNGEMKLYEPKFAAVTGVTAVAGAVASNSKSKEEGVYKRELRIVQFRNVSCDSGVHQVNASGGSSTKASWSSGAKGVLGRELDGPNAVRIRDGWVIAVERGVRERLKELAALRSIQLRDIEAILDHQINETGASTSEERTRKDVTSNQVTVTIADEDVRNTNTFFSKLSNGTIPKGVSKDSQDTREGKIQQERKDVTDKQQNSSDETNLLQPVQSNNKVGERRASSPFQNGRTEVLIGEPEGGPRSPRGSTSSAINDGNFLNPPDEREAIYRKLERCLNEGLGFRKIYYLTGDIHVASITVWSS